MAYYTPVQIRQAVATRVSGLTGWTESPYLPSRFPMDTTPRAHLSFTVIAGDETVRSGRGTAAHPFLCDLPCRVRFLYRIRPLAGSSDPRTDYDAAWTACDTADKRLQNMAPGAWPTGAYDCIYQATSEPNPVDTGDYLQCEVVFLLTYYRALT